ncbi:hypothetical protein AC249_AIPGENE24897 [Exaiptasia diaphana]|nr:hypothetical protein AC249_AIPGENE24897 [Exaiptasia diaphana]
MADYLDDDLSFETPVEPIKAPVEPTKAPVALNEAPLPSNVSSVDPPVEPIQPIKDTNPLATGQMYDPDAALQTRKATPSFAKFLETNFRRKLSYDQVLTIFDNWSSPEVESLSAPKPDQLVLNQVPQKMKKFVQERDRQGALHSAKSHAKLYSTSLQSAWLFRPQICKICDLWVNAATSSSATSDSERRKKITASVKNQ